MLLFLKKKPLSLFKMYKNLNEKPPSIQFKLLFCNEKKIIIKKRNMFFSSRSSLICLQCTCALIEYNDDNRKKSY